MNKNLGMEELLQLIYLSMLADHYNQAQLCLNEVQTRLNALVKSSAIEPNELLAELETKELMLDEAKRRGVTLEQVAEERIDAVSEASTNEKLESGAKGQQIYEKWESDGRESREPEPGWVATSDAEMRARAKGAAEVKSAGPPRDKNGKITRISVKEDDPGYDPEVYKNKALKIYCDGKHIVPAHTADTVLGLVRYHEKNEQGRIKTLELHGKVEIRGLE